VRCIAPEFDAEIDTFPKTAIFHGRMLTSPRRNMLVNRRFGLHKKPEHVIPHSITGRAEFDLGAQNLDSAPRFPTFLTRLSCIVIFPDQA